MEKLQVKVDHALGASEARKRLEKASEVLRKEHGSLVASLVWSASGAHVAGAGFEGDLTVGEREVVADVELGFPASLMPLKARREVEAWLRGALA